MIKEDFLRQLTDAVNKARTEYELEFQDAWLRGDIEMSPDEYIAMTIGGFAVKWVEDQSPKAVQLPPTGRAKGGQATVKLPSHATLDSPSFDRHANRLLRSLQLPASQENRSHLYNFIGALRTDAKI